MSKAAWRAIQTLASGQKGYFLTRQGVEAGLSNVELGRAVNCGDLERPAHGVYKFAGAPEISWAEVWIEWLRTSNAPAYDRTNNPDVIAVGLTAAAVYEIGNLGVGQPQFVAKERRQSRRGVQFRTGTLAEGEWEIQKGFPVERPAQIGLRLMREGTDEAHVEDLLVDAVQKGYATSDDVTQALDELGPRGVAAAIRVRNRTGTGMRAAAIKAVDEKGLGIEGAEILAIAPNDTFHQGRTNASGLAELVLVAGREYRLFVAHPNARATATTLKPETALKEIEVPRTQASGSAIFMDDSGYIPGLAGRLNPIMDAQHRTYLYTSNIAIAGGVPQPHGFKLRDWIELEDAHGARFDMRVIEIRGRPSLLEYRPK